MLRGFHWSESVVVFHLVDSFGRGVSFVGLAVVFLKT